MFYHQEPRAVWTRRVWSGCWTAPSATHGRPCATPERRAKVNRITTGLLECTRTLSSSGEFTRPHHNVSVCTSARKSVICRLLFKALTVNWNMLLPQSLGASLKADMTCLGKIFSRTDLIWNNQNTICTTNSCASHFPDSVPPNVILLLVVVDNYALKMSSSPESSLFSSNQVYSM